MSDLVVVPDKDMPNLYRVMYERGEGATPDALKGLFSTRIAAKKRIAFYEARPRPQPIEYKGQKKISDEEEAEIFAAVQKQVEAENNGKEEEPEKKNKGRTKSVRKGANNRGNPAKLS